MSAQLDESTKVPLSDRVRGWMWKGMEPNGNGNGKVEAKAEQNGHAETESPSHANGNGDGNGKEAAIAAGAEVDESMRRHLENMVAHAGGIQQAASTDAVRIRTGALDTATRVLAQVDKLEAELLSMEVAFGEILRVIHSELSEARTMLANERTAAEQANGASA
jgi:hypothetical protein